MWSAQRQRSPAGRRADGRDPIAVVGIGCRFPGGGDGPDAYWRFLMGAGDGVVEAPASRFDLTDLYDPEPGRPGKLYSRHLGALEGVEAFDPEMFGISRREAAAIDPQQRLLLEVAWESLENAGIAPADVAGAGVGVFIGEFSDDYAQTRLYDRKLAEVDGYTSLGVLRGLAAGRIAYHFDLHGPAMTVDTACSSALLAIHLACRSLWVGECDAALAGGVNLVLSPEVTLSLCQLRALSMRGQCRTFDAAADGYVRGEGAGIVVLKRLADALADGDRILALVRGSAVNHDGRSNGISAPNVGAQEAVIRAALDDAGVAPAEIDYVEAHGTGTALGDPIEVRALASVFGAGRAAPLRIGAVKSNIGHLEAAAGAAGFIKLALALAHRELPPNLHFETPNPHIPWDRIPIRVVDRPTPFDNGDRRPVGSTSAFGMSGTNVHVVLEAPPPPPPPAPAGAPHITALSARTPEALRRLTGRYAEMLSGADAPDLADIARTASVGRAHHPVRLAVVARTREEVAAALATDAAIAAVRTAPKIGFVFSGEIVDRRRQAAFLAGEPAARQLLDASNEALNSLLGRSLDELVATGPSAPDAAIVDVILCHALAALWEACGIRPAAVLGLGFGEYAAALVAGAIDVPAMAALLAARRQAGNGQDAAVLRPAFAEAARRGRLARPLLPVISGMLGRPVTDELTSPYYWADHAVSQADPAGAATSLADARLDAVIDLGAPADLVLPPGIRRFDGSGRAVTRQGFLETLGELYTFGATVDWRAVERDGRSVSLPTYPFDAVICRIDRSKPRFTDHAGNTAGREQPIDVAGSPNLHVRTELSTSDVKLLSEHVVFGALAMPAAAICDIVAAAGRAALHLPAVVVEDIAFLELLPVDPAPALQTVIAPGGTFELYARAPATGWKVHARGRVGPPDGSMSPLPPSPPSLPTSAATVSGEAVYDQTGAAGVRHGPAFRGLIDVRLAGRDAEARIELPEAAARDGSGFALHPSLIDACFVSLQPLLPKPGDDRGWLPAGIARFECAAPLPTRVLARTRLAAVSPRQAVATILLLDESRAVIGRIDGLSLRSVALSATAAKRAEGPRPEVYAITWRPMDGEIRPAAPPPPSSWAIVGCGQMADRLARRLATLGERSRRVDGPDIPQANRIVVFATDRNVGAVARATRVLEQIRAVARRAGPTARLAIVTTGTRRATPDDVVTDVDGAAIWGLARVARRELPALDIVTVDLPGADDEAAPERLADVLEVAARGEEIALRRGGALVCRLAKDVAMPTVDTPVRLPEPDGAMPGPGEVAIDVVASGLNFRDVLHHLGRLPESAARMPYGLECAGRVAAVGPGVGGLAPGDPVIAGLTVNSLSGRVLMPQEFVVARPPSLSYRDAASLPLAFVTAHYALDRLAGLKRGERVLIHAAAGGVGQAAIQVARRAGAEIFATASPGKWDYLRRQGIAHVFNSRDGSFAEAILTATGGKGVDVVLNSLSGEVVSASLACLAEGGHFIEIGKLEEWSEDRVASLPRGIRFSSFDLWDVKEDAGLVAQMMAEMVARIRDGSLSPLRSEAFPIGSATRAFHHMARARHIGKIVIDQDVRAFVRPDAAYLVTGGLGALGLFTARWLVDRGAAHIVLVGRSPPGEGARQAIAALEAQGAEVRVVRADVADADSMAALLSGLDESGMPLAGIVHAAGVLDDASIANQTPEKFAAVMRPKLDGARVLDRLTRARPLDFFLIYASAAGILGNPGQANYCAANTALDALAEARTAAGLPTIAIDWGPWAGIGMAARAGLRPGDVGAIDPAEAGALLDRLMLSGQAQCVVLAIDWPAWLQASGSPPPLLSLFSARAAAADAPITVPPRPPILAELEPLDERERARRLRAHVRRLVANALEVGPEKVDPRQELATLGFDSVMSMELKAGLESGLGIGLGSTLAFDYPTVDAITRHLLEDVVRWDAAGPEARNGAGEPRLNEAEAAASEADAALLRELASLKQSRAT